MALGTLQTGNAGYSALDCRAETRKKQNMRIFPWIFPLALLFFSTTHAAVEVRGTLVPAREKGEDGKPKPSAPAGRGGGPKPIEQNRVLEVTVRNQGSKPEAGITVRYWFVGRDAKTSKLVLLDGGESQINLRPNGTEIITSEQVKSKWTPRPAFVQPPARTSNGKPATGLATPPPKEATGTRISGYAVQVIHEGKVIASDVMDDSIKKLIGSDGNKPGPLFKADKSEAAAE
jgi:hypothetical protein